MSTTKDYKDFILDQLSEIKDITCKPMMSEYLLYQNGILFGGIYDNRLLIKVTPENQKYHMPQEIPYQNAKPMYLVEDLDDQEKLKEVIITTAKSLKKERKVQSLK